MAKRRNRGAKRKEPSLSDLSRQRPTPEQWQKVFEEIDNQTDRGAALIAGSLADATVRLALSCKLIQLTPEQEAAMFESPTAPLANFSARIKVARACGIFGAEMEGRLNTIRLVRNQFAHALIPLDFSHPLIVKECLSLPIIMPEDHKLPDNWSETRLRYVATCVGTATLLIKWSMDHGGETIVVEID